MDSKLQLFSFEGNQVRALEINDEPWFVATDVTKILNLSNTTVALSRLDEDERSKFNLGRQGKANIVNEYGLYKLILASRKPSAKKFQRWVTHDVLPAIRKHGAYMTDRKAYDITHDQSGTALADLLQQAADQLKSKDIQINQMKPKALFADAVATSHSDILIGQLAKIIKQNGYNTGQNRLFKWLREHHYLCSKGIRYNQPTQKAMEMGLFKVKERTINNPDGSSRIIVTTKVTGKGQQYFINRFLSSEPNQLNLEIENKI
ncbi:MAG TPA: phage repressor protein/antirepressor Ant [Lactobacillus acetotolerans]|jgi:anti-repressor protein|nr:phage repressor protein/antirepressor Ant [Lactobacillus acetotolerans]